MNSIHPLFLFISSIIIIKRIDVTHYIHNLSKLFFKKPEIIERTPLQQFIYNNSKRFLNSFHDPIRTFNDNIEPCFYDKTKFNEIMTISNNYIELQWNRRILLCNTPYGNIIMKFSPYKMGFEYYSDSRSIPYNILNSVSMKYCLLYYCRDFFVDNSITYEDKHSRLISIHFRDSKKKLQTKLTTSEPDKCLQFAKLKNYKTSDLSNKSSLDMNAVSNRFIYLGKICNYSLLQSIKPICNNNGFHSNLLDNNIQNDTSLQTNVLNYKSFKKSLENNK